MLENQKVKEAVDLLVSNERDMSTILKEGGLIKQLTKALLEKALEAEMDDHLGYNKYARNSNQNSRNGTNNKNIITENGVVELEVPRDRESDFEPQLVPKRKTRIDGLDDKILSMYAKGMSLSDIKIQLQEL